MAVGKKELVTMMAEKTKTTKKTAGELYDAFVESVTDMLFDGEDVAISGLVSFKNEHKPAHKRTVYFSGKPEEIQVEERIAVKAKASKTLDH